MQVVFLSFFQLCRELLRRQACAAAAEKLAGEPAAALELSVACRQPRGAHREWVGLPCLGSRMSLSLHSDSENSSSSDQHGPVFGSARVLPDSPTPYTDATQVCNDPLCKLLAPLSHVLPFLSAQPDTLPSVPSSGRHNNFYSMGFHRY